MRCPFASGTSAQNAAPNKPARQKVNQGVNKLAPTKRYCMGEETRNGPDISFDSADKYIGVAQDIGVNVLPKRYVQAAVE